jgi:hypothetical protein
MGRRVLSRPPRVKLESLGSECSALDKMLTRLGEIERFVQTLRKGVVGGCIE